MPEAYADHLWRGKDSYPTLYLDDVSDIPFLVNIAGVEEYQHRARVRAGDGDLFAAVTPPVEGYETYCREVLNLGSPKLVLAENRRTPLAVAEACCHGAALRTIVGHARAAGGLHPHPYMGIESVWELARHVSRDARVPVTVIGPPPPVTWIANDKQSFSELVEQTLGDDWLVRTEFARTPRDLARYLVDIAKNCERVGLKRTRCASAMGNAVFDASEVLSGDPDALVRAFLERTEWDGDEDVLAVAWEESELSPSTQCWLPPRGQGVPVVEGVYEQILEGPEKVFVGSRPSTHAINERLIEASVRVATELQELGYVGRCSFDFIVSEDGEPRFTECNGRWGGTSIPMSLVDRLIGGERPPYRAQDYVHTTLEGASFQDILRRVGDDLYDPETRRGRFVFYNVGPLARSGKLDVIALGATVAEAEEALVSGLARRLTAC